MGLLPAPGARAHAEQTPANDAPVDGPHHAANAPAMTHAAILQLTNPALPLEERIVAAAATGALLRDERPLDAAWRALNSVITQGSNPVALRCAAVAALGNAPGAAVNQLVRTFEDDSQRLVRKAALDTLKAMGADPVKEARLKEQLDALHGPQRVMVVANLAAMFGHDTRVLDALAEALNDDAVQVRMFALTGLAMLGRMEPVVAALQDADAAVRIHALEMVGIYSTLENAHIIAVGKCLGDADAAVQKAAKTALRRMGIQPMAAPPARKKVAASRSVDAWDWRARLENHSLTLLKDRAYAVTLEDAVVHSGWLGFDGATRAQVVALEKRLGRALPPSYAAFLETTNGWRHLSQHVDQLLPAEQVNHFRVGHQDWIAAWSGAAALPGLPPQHPLVYGANQDCAVFDHRLLQGAVQVSSVMDGVVLLVPEVSTPAGEWEAWLFASWLPGARRFPSFAQLMQAEMAAEPGNP